MHITEQNKASKPTLSFENNGPVLTVKLLKQEITMQKESCLH